MRTASHQLKNGLYVSGRPEQAKERQPTMASRAMPYTGGDVKKSGELGKMYGIDSTGSGSGPYVHKPASRAAPPSSQSGGAVRSRPNSGQQGHKSNNSGSIPKKSSSFSGPTPIQPTGLITSNSGPLDSSGAAAARAVQPEPSASFNKKLYSSAVTRLVKELKPRGSLGFLKKYPDAELRGAVDGQYVKVTGMLKIVDFDVIGNLLEWLSLVAVFHLKPRFRGHQDVYMFPRNCMSTEVGVENLQILNTDSSHGDEGILRLKFVADFYISDFQSGLRALVKAGYGAKVSPFVKPSTVVDVTQSNRDLSPNFLQWLSDRNLSSDDRIMRLKEGYIKEGSTVSVMGVVRRHANVLMIVPPGEPVSTGCQWASCLPPTNIEALVLACDETQNSDESKKVKKMDIRVWKAALRQLPEFRRLCMQHHRMPRRLKLTISLLLVMKDAKFVGTKPGAMQLTRVFGAISAAIA
nr:uncharacterized membrane protein At1g16860-like [Ipomoea batatas]